MIGNYFLSCYAARPIEPMEVHPSVVINQDEMDALCPLDVTTGKRCEPLVRALQDDCGESERQALLATLQSVKTSTGFESLSDDVKLQLCKLRSLQTPSELKEFAGYVDQICDSLEIDVPEFSHTSETPDVSDSPDPPAPDNV